jgi:MFS transporter, Spinster family, sphingosine-1-phosphate transporter
VNHELPQTAPGPVDGVTGQARTPVAQRSALALLCALLVLDFADRQVVVTVFPYLRTEFAVTETQLGALVSAVSVLIALGALPAALVVDRWSRVRAIAVMGSLWSIATAACALAPGYLALLAARIGIGVGQAGFGPSGSALLGATYPPERRATVLGVFQMGAPLGVVTGSVAGSLVAAHWGWRSAFLVVALPGLVLALLALRLRDYPSLPQRARARVTAAALLHARSAQGAMLGGALLLVIVSTLYTWLPTHLEHAYRLPPARAGILASTVVLAGALGTVTAGHVADRLARRHVRYRMLVPAATAVATTATLGSAFAVVPPGPTQIVLILLGGATATTAIGPAAAVVLDVVPAAVRATAVAMYAVVQNLMGLAVGPVLTGVLADRWDLTTALTTVAATGLAAALAFWWGSRTYHQDRTSAVLRPSLPTNDRPGVAEGRPSSRRGA